MLTEKWEGFLKIFYTCLSLTVWFLKFKENPINIDICISPSLYLWLEAVKTFHHAITQTLPSIHSAEGGKELSNLFWTLKDDTKKVQTGGPEDQGFIMVLKTSIAFLLFSCFACSDIWGLLFRSSVSYTNFLSYLNKKPLTFVLACKFALFKNAEVRQREKHFWVFFWPLWEKLTDPLNGKCFFLTWP